MKTNQAELPVRSQCEALGVSTSGYYDWLDREPSARAQANVTLLLSIRQAHLASDETYGMPRIRAELAYKGFPTFVKHHPAVVNRAAIDHGN